MLTAQVTRDIREDALSAANASVARTGSKRKAANEQVELGGSILTYDLEDMAGRYRAAAAKRLARRLFRILVKSDRCQRASRFRVSGAKQTP